ncbi:TDP-N-acetylfucosamine:lipid II N-acetylfucosaminyltransferase [Flavobacterium sp.]|uniref:TDP-N-acetylfucosamine:lipid II N-acetylfucosaminyltransferase n=1 Tax=Flavobacterium sp. TaxID=239 RepID=UPI00262DF4E6|nr:TDP-N-acetylfucosamine:lipid II N-acetylfucosaminyltransferase [Flavobacterium sp.]MDD3003988.1 TDP-N-acetylfucosamine:lipid II N-acetylfucosaminyltransferase [Flavobacterium sp.]
MPNSVQIIHICQDEKFINAAVTQFEYCFPNSNTFYAVTQNPTSDYKHINGKPFIHKILPQEAVALAHNIPKSTLVILHSLSPFFIDFVLQLPKKNKIIWLCFGFEVYNDTHYFEEEELLEKLTRTSFPNPPISRKKRIKEHLRPWYRIFKPGLELSRKEKKQKAIARIDFLGSSFSEEYAQVGKLIQQRKQFFNFWYYPLELIVDVTDLIYLPKKNLLIGNSGFKSGNHLDVFHAIKTFSIPTDAQVIVPLNYGESAYIQEILVSGKKHFKTMFYPLLNFMPLYEYNTLLESVGVAIFNNKRQQAVGNTIALLWFGTKVFLSNKNSFYHYLKRKGAIVYCYETELNEQSISQFLSLEQMEHNRKILFQELNQAHLADVLKQQINRIYAKITL